MPDYQLTVITPVYNGAAYIERALRNVIDENCPEVEHLVMDGGSKDGTQAIVERLAAEHPRLRLVSERDAGQSDAMNKGIALAAAPVISFLNADDTYQPGTLRRVLSLLPDLPAPGFLVGNCNVWDESGRITWVNRPAHLRLDDLLVGSLKMQAPMNPAAYFYHRSLHDLVGLYDVNDSYTMDLEFLLRALPAANVRYHDEIWGNFYSLPGAKTHDDFADGTGWRRADLIYRREIAKLPPVRRAVVQLRRALYKMGKGPGLLKYYATHPAMLVRRLKHIIKPPVTLAPSVTTKSGV